MSAGDTQDGTDTAGKPGSDGSPPAVSGPADNGPHPVVVVHHCGPRLPPTSVNNATGVFCQQPLLQCALADGASENVDFEVTNTVTTQPDGTTSSQIACDVPVASAAQPQVTAADIEQWVVRQLPIGSIGTVGARSLVNLKTVVWLDVPASREWGPVTIIQAGVRIKATLVSVHWNFGDGTTDVAPDAGIPYDTGKPCDAACAAYYGHTYANIAGPVQVTAQAYWRAEFSVNGSAFTALPAPVAAIAPPPVSLTIVQAHSQLVSGS